MSLIVTSDHGEIGIMSSTQSTRGRAMPALVWILVVCEALMMGLAGWSKFGSAEVWRSSFEGWGYPSGFSYFVGGVEIMAAALLLVPRLSSYAAMILIVVMAAALATVLLSASPMGPGAPLIHLALLSLIVRTRWASRWKSGLLRSSESTHRNEPAT